MGSFSKAASFAALAISASVVKALHDEPAPPQQPLRRILEDARDSQIALAKSSDPDCYHQISVGIIQSLLDRLDRVAMADDGLDACDTEGDLA